MGRYAWISSFLAHARQTHAPPRASKDGLLPPLLVGALVGALFVLHVHIVYPLAIALVILAAVALTGFSRSRSHGTSPPAV